MENSFIRLSHADKTILQSYKTLVEGLANYLGDGYEFVLHSLENLDKSAIKVVNGYHSKRSEGAPITDLALSMLDKIRDSHQLKSLCYFNRNKEEKLLKSCTIPIPGENSRIIGLLCINFYMDTPLSSVIEALIPQEAFTPHLAENYAENIDDLILTSLEEVKEAVFNDPSISSVNKNKEIISCLYHKGVFNLKDAVIKVAKSLNISKNTVYMHIRNSKAE